MEASQQTETDEEPSRHGSTLARALAPEDVRPGQFVTLLHEYVEVPSYFWCRDMALLSPEETVWIRTVPPCGGTPLKVKSVCLPFVLAKHPWGDHSSLDLRKCRVARLGKRYAVRAWKAYKKSKPPNDCR